MLERQRTNLAKNSSLGVEDEESVLDSRGHVSYYTEADPDGRFLVSWFWKEWVADPVRWFHRFFSGTPCSLRWVRYCVRVNDFDECHTTDMLRIKPAQFFQVERANFPSAYVPTGGDPDKC